MIAQLQAHYDADEIVQGRYWENGRGCAVGCTVHSDAHSLYPVMWGIPEEIGEVQDVIFEGLHPLEAKEFPLQFARAIPVGADLSLVTSRFLHWLFEDVKRLIRREDALQVADRIVALYGRRLAGDEPKKWEWENVSIQAQAVLVDYADVVRQANHASVWALTLSSRISEYGAAAQRDCLLRLLAEAQ